MTSLKFQMRLDVDDISATNAIASELAHRTGSPFQTRATAIRYSFSLAKQLLDADLLSLVESMLADARRDRVLA